MVSSGRVREDVPAFFPGPDLVVCLCVYGYLRVCRVVPIVSLFAFENVGGQFLPFETDIVHDSLSPLEPSTVG